MMPLTKNKKRRQMASIKLLKKRNAAECLSLRTVMTSLKSLRGRPRSLMMSLRGRGRDRNAYSKSVWPNVGRRSKMMPRLNVSKLWRNLKNSKRRRG